VWKLYAVMVYFGYNLRHFLMQWDIWQKIALPLIDYVTTAVNQATNRLTVRLPVLLLPSNVMDVVGSDTSRTTVLPLG
jgi:hypothetical protein